MRNRLVHEYFGVDLEIVWNVVQTEVPQLTNLLEPLVPPEALEGERAGDESEPSEPE